MRVARPLIAMLVVTLASAEAGALEKALPLTASPGAAPGEPDWAGASATIEVVYYNVCTGWVWIWSGVPPFATYGVHYDDPSASEDRILRTHVYFADGAPAGYGYSVIARVMGPFDPTCPGGALETHVFTPLRGWNTIEWNGDEGIAVEESWVLLQHSENPGDPTKIVTEKGEPGGPRPGGCGLCYGPERVPHSFQFGMEPVIVCPGAPWRDDSACALELLWSSEFRVGTVRVESASWGRLKSLYR